MHLYMLQKNPMSVIFLAYLLNEISAAFLLVLTELGKVGTREALITQPPLFLSF